MSNNQEIQGRRVPEYEISDADFKYSVLALMKELIRALDANSRNMDTVVKEIRAKKRSNGGLGAPPKRKYNRHSTKIEMEESPAAEAEIKAIEGVRGIEALALAKKSANKRSKESDRDR